MKAIESYENSVDLQTNFNTTSRIMEKLDTYIWYDSPKYLEDNVAKAKSREVIFALVQVLVDKRVINEKDVIKALYGKED